MKAIFDRKMATTLADIGFTAEVLEDYIVDHNWVQAKKHLSHMRGQLKTLSEYIIQKDVELKD